MKTTREGGGGGSGRGGGGGGGAGTLFMHIGVCSLCLGTIPRGSMQALNSCVLSWCSVPNNRVFVL